MKRIYLDFNATSPLAPSVKRWLAEGDLFWANPASQHSSGKFARARLDEVTRFLLNSFHLNSGEFKVLYHSGATEGINTWVQGQATKKKSLYVYSPLDHACVKVQKQVLENLGHQTLELPTDSNGNIDVLAAAQLIQQKKAVDAQVLLNWTWVHNETGVVWPLTDAIKLKELTGALLHVDAVQAPAKVADWQQLNASVDAYTFSGHKFGSLKGVGWSFVANATPFAPLIWGGGQQDGARAGTESVMGAWSLKLALEDLIQEFNADQSWKMITELRSHLDGLLKDKGRRICVDARQLNLNTVYFVLNALPADMSLALFDLAGLEVSAGSACGSGTAKPNPVLIALGEQNLARHGLRLSLGRSMDESDFSVLKKALSQVFEKIPRA